MGAHVGSRRGLRERGVGQIHLLYIQKVCSKYCQTQTVSLWKMFSETHLTRLTRGCVWRLKCISPPLHSWLPSILKVNDPQSSKRTVQRLVRLVQHLESRDNIYRIPLTQLNRPLCVTTTVEPPPTDARESAVQAMRWLVQQQSTCGGQTVPSAILTSDRRTDVHYLSPFMKLFQLQHCTECTFDVCGTTWFYYLTRFSLCFTYLPVSHPFTFLGYLWRWCDSKDRRTIPNICHR